MKNSERKKIENEKVKCREKYQITMSDPITEPSICIPRTLNNVSWRDVKETFEKILGKGTVERVDIVTRRDEDTPFCRIFVHMRYWPVNDQQVAAWRNTLMNGGEMKVVYNHPWFWKCVASRIPKPEKKNVSAQPYIMPPTPCDDDNKKSVSFATTEEYSDC
tara:strand:+ start:1599 stop:2084 length:486 start_codon:yes stop_codon:yes gene_type:complete